MSEEQLQLLITMDDPGDLPEEDTFNHLQAHNFKYWLDQQFLASRRLGQETEAVSDNEASRLTFGQGDWTCTLSRLTGATNDAMKNLNVEVCTVTHWNNGEVVEQKLFCDLVGMQKQLGTILSTLDHRAWLGPSGTRGELQ